MPIPKPHNGEEQQAFVSRCISAIHGEYTAEGQAAAICYSAWRDRDKSMQLLEAARQNLSGIITADRYFKSIQGCFEGGLCPTDLWEGSSPEQWTKALEEAAERLVYSNPDMVVKDLGFTGLSITPGAVMDFDAIITSTKQDRDGDILETGGATFDPKMPLLWQHIPMQPIGKMVALTSHTKDMAQGRFAIADTALGRDAAVLVEMDALRISHGFEALEYEPIEKGGRFRIKKLAVLETSLVSVPSNTDAIITAFSRHKLHAPLIKNWAGKLFEKRPVTVAVALDLKTPKPPCACEHKAHAIKGLPAPEEEFSSNWERIASKALGKKHFNPEMEYVPPSKLEYEWVSRYLGVELKHIFQNETRIPAYRCGSFLEGLKNVQAEYGSVREDCRNINGNGTENPPVYEVIQLNSKESRDYLIDGIGFYKSEAGRFVINIQPDWSGVRMIVYTADDQAQVKLNRELIDKTWNWAIENNFMKGEAFNLSGDFLPRTGETFEDLFLTKKNEDPLKLMISQVNKKGKNTPNRGMIFLGPPGTGKTLSGRIIKNDAKSTFIWISSRDFWKFGSFGSITAAFDMAKELAPAVIFFEDIDNWIGDTTTDLLKTELDGIGRSTGVVTILTTNYPERFPAALIDRPGRFHDVLKFDLPTEEERKRMLKKWLPDLDEVAVKDALKRTAGYSGAHVYELAKYAKTIQESEELQIGEAVTKALDKIKEQRELIDENQLSGSHYKPRRAFSGMQTKRFSAESSGFLMCQCGHVGIPAEFCKGNDDRVGCPACGVVGPADSFRPARSSISLDEAGRACIEQAASDPTKAKRIAEAVLSQARLAQSKKDYADLLSLV